MMRRNATPLSYKGSRCLFQGGIKDWIPHNGGVWKVEFLDNKGVKLVRWSHVEVSIPKSLKKVAM